MTDVIKTFVKSSWNNPIIKNFVESARKEAEKNFKAIKKEKNNFK